MKWSDIPTRDQPFRNIIIESMNDCIIFISGYGDTTSTLVGQVSSEDVPYVCIADLPDNPRVRSEFLFPPIIGQLSHTMKLFSLIFIF